MSCTSCFDPSQFPSSSPSSNWLSSLRLSQDYNVGCLACSSFDTVYNLASSLASSWLSPASLINAEADALVFYQSFNATVNLWSKLYGRSNQALPNSSCLKLCLKLCHLNLPSSPNPSHPNLGTNQGLSQSVVKSSSEFCLKPSLCPSSSESHHFVLVQSQLLHIDLLQLSSKLLNCRSDSKSIDILNQGFAFSWTHQGANLPASSVLSTATPFCCAIKTFQVIMLPVVSNAAFHAVQPKTKQTNQICFLPSLVLIQVVPSKLPRHPSLLALLLWLF